MHAQLYKAARMGDVNLLKDIAARNAQLLYSEGPEEQTAMHIASRWGHVEFVKKMLELCGTHIIGKQNSDEDTPLHCAARNGMLEMVEILVPISSSDVEGGHATPVRMTNKRGNTPLHDAVIKGHDLVAIRLLQIDPSLSLLTNNVGESTLHLAAKAQLPGVIQEIFNNVLDEEKMMALSKQDNSGRTALHYAACANNSEIVDMLLESHSSAAYILDRDGYSPLHIAVAFGYWKTVLSLLSHCPDALEQRDSRGRNAFHISILCYSCLEGLPEEFLVLRNEPDKDGNTPLHLAVKLYSARLIRWLLSLKGVKLNIKNNDGLTALNIAESLYRNHHYLANKVVEALKRHGAVRGQPWRFPKIPDDTPPHNDETEMIKEVTASYAVGVALVATVSFSAIFTVPGGLKEDGTPILATQAAFKVFLFSNTIAMCSAIVAGICLIRETYTRSLGEIWGLDYLGYNFVGLAYVAMLVTFLAAVHMVIAPEYIWIVIVVFVICCSPLLLDIYLLARTQRNKIPHGTFVGKILGECVDRIGTSIKR